MHKIIKNLFIIGIIVCILSIFLIIGTYLAIKPNLPEIKYVDESELQMPLKVYTKDGYLIGEFGEIKRRATSFDDIPIDIKNAFLSAEDDNFFNHQGISYTGLIRSFVRCVGPSGCQGGGGTITMQVVRGYLLTPEQTIVRKIKEIFLALELEGKVEKEEIFELYVNRIFLGNRSYGIEAAANTYFNKNLSELLMDITFVKFKLKMNVIPKLVINSLPGMDKKELLEWFINKKISIVAKAPSIPAQTINTSYLFISSNWLINLWSPATPTSIKDWQFIP